MSTRQASALPTWKPSKPAEGSSARPSSTGHSGPPKPAAKSAQPKAAPAPPPDPAIVRKERLKANRNFDSDSDSEADKQRSRESHTLSKLEQRIAAAEQEAAAKRPAPKPQHALLQQQQQLTYKSPYSVSGKAAVSKGRTVLPKGKAGAASRNMALAPQVSPLSHQCQVLGGNQTQAAMLGPLCCLVPCMPPAARAKYMQCSDLTCAIGELCHLHCQGSVELYKRCCVMQAIALSRKQMADRGIRQAVDSVRSQALPSQLSQKPAMPTQRQQMHAAASSSGRPLYSMPSPGSRPLQSPSSHNPACPTVSSNAQRHSGSHLPAQQYQAGSASQMPAWAQKAKQAGLDNLRARSIMYSCCVIVLATWYRVQQDPSSSYLSNPHSRGSTGPCGLPPSV